MTETLVTNKVGFSAAVGPDLLRIPAEPNRLKQAGQQLGELADQLAKSGEHLTGADGGHEDRQGHTTSALMGVATWNGKRLGKDGTLLRELSGAVDHAAQVIGDIQAHDLPQLRRRWAQAQDQFMTEMRHAVERDTQERQQAEREEQQRQHAAGGNGGGNGGGQHGGGHDGGDRRVAANAQVFEPGPAQAPAPHQPPLPHADALLQQLDEHLVQPYADLFRELHGPHSSVGGGGGGDHQAFLSDSRTEHTISAYRQTVRSVLDEFSALAQRVQQADKAIEERSAYPQADKSDDEGAVGVAMVSGDMVSGVVSLRHLVKDLRDGAQANNQAHEQLKPIATALADGRLPAHGDKEHERFGADWEHHFQRRTERLRTVCSRVDDVLEKFSRLDEECAAAIRAH